MVQSKIRSIDADGHVIEDPRKILEHLEAPYRSWYVGRGGRPSLLPSDGAPRGLGGKLRSGAGDSTESWLNDDAGRRAEVGGSVPHSAGSSRAV
jgi:hypothetical protein